MQIPKAEVKGKTPTQLHKNGHNWLTQHMCCSAP